MSSAWWQTFFDDEYVKIWAGFTPEAETASEARQLWKLLSLEAGSKVLDAPCGYGRLTQALAELGAHTYGVDQAQDLIDEAERVRGELSAEQLSYLCHDLREPIERDGFDAAINVFSSFGYGTDEDDRAMFSTIAKALKPGGLLFLDTMHRDVVVAWMSQDVKPSRQLEDGTVVVEEPKFDPFAGRIETTWYWKGPTGEGSKSASIRIYCITEIVQLLASAGFEIVSKHAGITPAPFEPGGADMGGRLGLLCRKKA